MNECDIFLGALEIDSPGDRTAYLDKACADDPQLRQRVQKLLDSYAASGSLLEHAAVETAATQVFADTTDGEVAGATGTRTIPEADDIPLDFLEPADQPASLGRLGQYEILAAVGRGGMGIVLKAQDTKLNRVVAVKVLAPELAANATARKRFRREAQAAAAVSHDHVVTIYAVDENEPVQQGKLPYLVMEFVDGHSLQQKIDREGALELKEILRIGRQIAAGLAAAHEQGLIHRDVKPSNILLQNGVERVQITDFGLARAVDDVGMTRTGEVTGTPQYMSPEQAQGLPTDARSDLFSLGSVLYAMCTGRSPFRADTTMASLRRVCDETPRPIREINPDTPEWLAAIIDRLLEKTPDERFQTAAEVTELLGKHLAHLQNPGSTPFPGIVQPVQKAAAARAGHRRPKMATAIALAVAAIGMGVTEATGVTQISETVIRFTTGHGTLVIEVHDPTVSVSLDGNDVSFTGAGWAELRLKPGHYTVDGTKEGKVIDEQFVEVARGKRTTVSVRYLPATSDAQDAALGEGSPDPVPRHAITVPVGVREVVPVPGGKLLTIGRDHVVRLWSLTNSTEIRAFSGHFAIVRKLALLPDGRRFATASFGRTVRVWNLANDDSRVLVGHQGDVYSVVPFPDANRILSGGHDMQMIEWDLESGKPRHIYKTTSKVYSVAIASDGRRLFCGTEDGEIQIWRTGADMPEWRIRAHDQAVHELCVSPDGQSVLSAGSTDGVARLWDLQTGEQIHESGGHRGWIHAIAISQDGQWALSGGQRVLSVWRLETGEAMGSAIANGEFHSVAFAPDTDFIFGSIWRADLKSGTVFAWWLDDIRAAAAMKNR